MADQFWTNRRRRISLLAGIPVLLVLLVFFLLNALLGPVIGRKIKAAVLKGSDSLYRVSFSAIHLNVFTGSAELEDIRLIVDPIRAKSAGSVAQGSAKELKITHAHVLAYLFHKRLEIGNITLVDPDLAYALQKETRSKDHAPLYQKILPLKLIAVDRISLEHARLTYSDPSRPKTDEQHLKDLDLEVADLRIDSASERDTSRTFFCRDLAIVLNNFSGFTNGGRYHYGFRKAHFSTRSGKLTVRAIFLKPLAEKAFFQNSSSDRFEGGLDSLVLEGFNYRSFLRDHFLSVQKAGAYGGNLGVYGNPAGKLTATDRVRTFPHYMLRLLPLHFTVDTADVFGLAINYEEFNKESGKTGVLEFKNTKARFLNISNQAAKLKAQPLCRAQLSSWFMGAGKLELSIDFNLTDKNYSYRYQGHLGALQLTAINPLTMPLGLVKIKSGELRSLDFEIRANEFKSTGTLHLLYNDLTVDVLKPDYRTKMLKTLAVRVFVISKNNPDQKGVAPRFAKVVYLRPKSGPFFKTLWETLFSGLKPCAGIGYAVKPDMDKPLSKQEQKANKKALKRAVKGKKAADKAFYKKLEKRS